MGLPESTDEVTGLTHTDILVVVNKLTKMAYMVPTKAELTAKQMAYLLMQRVFASHGLPKEITPDRDKLFVSKFWSTLAEMMTIDRKVSTSYHQQTDGQSERTIQTIKQYLRGYVNYQQDDWVMLLPMAQFAYNDSMSRTTNETPFYANYGRNPQMPWRTISKERKSEEALTLGERMTSLHQQLSKDITFLTHKMATYYNRGRLELHLKKGEKVYLLRRHPGKEGFNIKAKRPNEKLDFQKLGPYIIEKECGLDNYQLKLPKSMLIHPIFHVSLLEPTENPAAEEQSNLVEKGSEYEVEEVLDYTRIDGQPHYLVKWKGFDQSENTWEPIKHLTQCQATIQRYHQMKDQTPKATTVGQGNPEQLPSYRRRKKPNSGIQGGLGPKSL
jgi:hypothetical protein